MFQIQTTRGIIFAPSQFVTGPFQPVDLTGKMRAFSSFQSLVEVSGLPLVLLLIPLALVIRALASGKRKNAEYIDGVPEVPNKHWFWGHMFYPPGGNQLDKQTAWCVDSADHKSGMCTFYFFRQPTVAVNKPEHAQKILRANTYKMSFPLFARLGDRIFGKNNITQINGKDWKIHRAPITRALQSEVALRSAQGHILRVGGTLIESILRRIKEEESNEQTTLRIVPVMKMATIDVFGAAALGRDIGSCKSLQPSAVATAFDFLGADVMRRTLSPLSPISHFLWIPTQANRRTKRENRTLRGFLRETILSHMREGSRKNLLSQMIAINSTYDSDDDAHLDINAMIDSMVVLLFAGYDTTANALSFALHQVSTDEVVEDRCVAEATKALAEMREKADDANGTNDEFDILARLPYCHAVLQESLRLYPPALATIRTIEKDLKLEDIILPAGTMVFIPIYHIHRDQKNFPRPTEFLPERWVRKTNDGQWVERAATDTDEVNGMEDLPPVANREAFLPFSSGARNCAGRRFALQEGTLLLAVLLSKLKFELEPGYKLKPDVAGPIMEAIDGLPMIVSRR